MNCPTGHRSVAGPSDPPPDPLLSWVPLGGGHTEGGEAAAEATAQMLGTWHVPRMSHPRGLEMRENAAAEPPETARDCLQWPACPVSLVPFRVAGVGGFQASFTAHGHGATRAHTSGWGGGRAARQTRWCLLSRWPA